MKADPNKRNFSIRLPTEIIAELDRMAAELGTLGATRNNIVEQACAWYVRAWAAHGNRPITETDMRDLENYLKEKLSQGNAPAHTAINPRSTSATSVGGSSTAKIPPTRKAG